MRGRATGAGRDRVMDTLRFRLSFGLKELDGKSGVRRQKRQLKDPTGEVAAEALVSVQLLA